MTRERWTAIGASLSLALAFAVAQQRMVTAVESQAQPGRAAAGEGSDLERGRYLVERVIMCVECHSSRDAQGNLVDETRFMGGAVPVRPPWPNDWALQTPRIAGLPGYTDAMAMRVFTEGAIGRNGTQLRLPMPRFHMTPEDAAAVIAYLRSL